MIKFYIQNIHKQTLIQVNFSIHNLFTSSKKLFFKQNIRKVLLKV